MMESGKVFDAAQLSGMAARSYRQGPLVPRLMTRYRPFICPFELMIARVPSGARVLDAACGGGLFLFLLGTSGNLCPRPGASVGFDLSPGSLDLARAAAAHAGLEMIRFERADMLAEWPRGDEDGLFDVVSVVDAMHHLPLAARRGAIQSAAARIRPGGILLYKDMCRSPAWRALANWAHDLIVARQWIHYTDIGVVRGWCEEAGLSIEEEGAANRLCYGHEWLVARREP